VGGKLRRGCARKGKKRRRKKDALFRWRPVHKSTNVLIGVSHQWLGGVADWKIGGEEGGKCENGSFARGVKGTATAEYIELPNV